MAQIQVFVGIDVSKDRLDIHVRPGGEFFSLSNDAAGFRSLLGRSDLAGAVIGCEATGGYEDALLVALSEAGRPGYCLHPADIRAFARLQGRRGKTDRLDARTIADALPHVLETRKPLVRTEKDSKLRELLTVRRALLTAQIEIRSHLSRMRCRESLSVLNQMHDLHKRRIAELERAIAKLTCDDPRGIRLRTAPGVGPQLAAGILAFLPEIGTLSSRRIASLVGVAPHPRQSGETTRPGRCQAGRAIVRRTLYMATLSVIKTGKGVIHGFYKRLRENGKPFKVAMVAAMRKLIVTLNAMIREEADWTPDMQS